VPHACNPLEAAQNGAMNDKRRSLALLALLALVGACGTSATSRPPSSASPTPTTEAAVTTTRPQATTSTPAAPPGTTVTQTTTAPPTGQQIAAQIASTHETIAPGEGFVGGSPVTVSDGNGGYLTAVPAGRSPSADGHGWLVFLWHNQGFLGWDTNRESWNVTVRADGMNAIEATYPDYSPGDPACCPSLPPVTITYSWNGTGLAQSRTLPAGAIVGIAVTSG